MGTTRTTQGGDEAGAMVAAVRAGDQSAFSALVERHRGELQVHCYRMLGSLEDSEDLVQETFLRAWRNRAGFQGRASLRTWLYRIATNACLDQLARRPRRPSGGVGGAPTEVLWLQPYPDHLLERVASDEQGPGEAVVAKETIELAFLVAIQHLPPRPRAVLIMRDVLGWSAKETADLLEVSVATANSALQRARAALKRHLPERRSEWVPGEDPSEQERELLRRYVEASENPDPGAFVAMLREDARFTMPPEPGVWVGAERIVASWQEGGFGTAEFGDIRCLLTRANMQPAVANYVRKPGEEAFRPMALDVIRIEEGEVAEIVTFHPELFAVFGLPATL